MNKLGTNCWGGVRKHNPGHRGRGGISTRGARGCRGGGHPVCPPWLPQLGDPGSCRHPSWTRVGDAEISPCPHGCCWDTSIRFTLFRWEVSLQRTCASFCWTPEIKILPPLPLFSVDPPCECVILDASAFLPGSFSPKLRGLQVRVEGLTSAAEDLGFPGRYLCMCRNARDPPKLVVRNSS